MFFFRLHYNGAYGYLFVNGTEIIKVKAKDFQIVSTLLCLGNISEDVTADNMRKTGLYGYVYNFSVDYDDDAIVDILDIYKNLMKKKWDSIKCFMLIKRVFVVAMAFFNCKFLECFNES